MALVIEDGTGKDDAESYADVAFVDAYISAGYLVGATSDEWTAATVEEKEQALRRATSYLDGEYLDQWKGRKGSSEQALSWPRVGVSTNDGYSVPSDSIPLNLQRAQSEVAIESVTKTKTLSPVVENTSGIKREKVVAGSVESDIEYEPALQDGTSTVEDRFPNVEKLLTDYIQGGNRIPLG